MNQENPKKFQPLLLVVAFAVSTPVLVSSQTSQVANCHTPESSGNFVGSDETIVNGMVCKMTKAESTQQQLIVEQSTSPAITAQSQQAAQVGDMTNARVVEMPKMGLDDDIS